MPYYHQPGPESRGSAMQGHCTPTTAPITATSQRAVHVTKSQIDGPADYRPQMVLSPTRDEYGRPINQFHRQPQYPQGQQWRRQHSQHPQVQARPVHQDRGTAGPRGPAKQQKAVVRSAVTTLLPYCTADVPLNESQVIAVTDVAGSLRELVLLALGAKDGDEDCASRLKGALDSERAMSSLVDFFSAEFEVE